MLSNLRSAFNHLSKRWKTNLGGGTTQNGRDSAGRRLGVKLGNGIPIHYLAKPGVIFLGAKVKVPEVIIRQRGFQYYPGDNVFIPHTDLNSYS